MAWTLEKFVFPMDQVSEYEHITEKRQLENLEKFSF